MENYTNLVQALASIANILVVLYIFYNTRKQNTDNTYKQHVEQAYFMLVETGRQANTNDFDKHLSKTTAYIGLHLTTKHKNKLTNYIAGGKDLRKAQTELYEIYKSL